MVWNIVLHLKKHSLNRRKVILHSKQLKLPKATNFGTVRKLKQRVELELLSIEANIISQLVYTGMIIEKNVINNETFSTKGRFYKELVWILYQRVRPLLISKNENLKILILFSMGCCFYIKLFRIHYQLAHTRTIAENIWFFHETVPYEKSFLHQNILNTTPMGVHWNENGKT